MSLNHSVKDVTPDTEYSEYKRSRHNRRYALGNQWRMRMNGWHMLSGIEHSFLYEFETKHQDCVRQERTRYVPYTRPTQVNREQWIKSPIEGVSPADIFSLAQLRYWNDPEQIYRPQYEMRRVLELSAEEIQTELMIFEMGLS